MRSNEEVWRGELASALAMDDNSSWDDLLDQVEARTATRPSAEGDIVQITDTSHHWFPALLVVDEVRAWLR